MMDQLAGRGEAMLFRFRWRLIGEEMQRQTQSHGETIFAVEKEWPTPSAPASHEHIPIRENSTRVEMEEGSKRLIGAGVYKATCVTAKYEKNEQYGRWDCIVQFVFNERGKPIPMYVPAGKGVRARFKTDHWFGFTLNQFDGDLSRLPGEEFWVEVRTVKKEVGSKMSKPPAAWYSVVHRAQLWKDHLLAVEAEMGEGVEPEPAPNGGKS